MMRRLWITLMISAFLLGSSASATIINVPGDYPTIQAGIDACSSGDTVMVADGIYSENVVIGLPLSLFGENRDGVVIDGSGVGDVVFIDSVMVSIGNLTVRNSGSELTDAGIELCVADSCLIEYCRFDDNYSGLFLYGSSYNIVARCLFSSNENGVHFHESYSEQTPDNIGNIITNNIIQNSNSCGIFFEHTLGTYHDSGVISGNRIIANQTGISMIMSYRNNIMRNDITDNDGYGITHMVCEGGGGDNVFHHNNFYENNQGDIQGCNLGLGTDCWYSDSDEEGNHWSDYTGPDNNGDGIGDIPYEIDGDQCQDIYPLMEPLYSTVSGCVSDLSGPIEGVYVQAIGTEVDDHTDIDGIYSLDSLGAGMYDILFMHPDYRDTTVAGAATTPGLMTELSMVMEIETDTDEENRPPPIGFEMVQNYPNPFNSRTVISFSLPQAGRVTIAVYDLLGREIRTLLDEYRQAGIHHVAFDATDLPSGIYFYSLQAGESVESRRMVLLK
jgi:parallel beta-helix repeat protein